MGFAVKREQVVFAEAVEIDVSYEHHLVIAGFEDSLEMVRGILSDTGKQLFVDPGHSRRGLTEPLSIGVFSQRLEQPMDAAGHLELVDFRLGRAVCLADFGESGSGHYHKP